MKKIASLIFAVLFAFMLASCDEDTAGVSVSSIDPANDLADYTSNGVTPSEDGVAEMQGVMEVTELLGKNAAAWGKSKEDDFGGIADFIETLTGPSEYEGASRTIIAPTLEELQQLQQKVINSEEVDVSISIEDESFALYDGEVTINGSATLKGSAKLGEASTSASAALTGDLNIVSTAFQNSNSYSSWDIEGIEARIKTASGMEMTMNNTTGAGSATVVVKAALSYGFTISDLHENIGSPGEFRAPSGKYVVTINISETVPVEFSIDSEEDPKYEADVEMTVEIYDNAGELLKTYTFDQDQLGNMLK